jgi:hypothetical protein
MFAEQKRYQKKTQKTCVVIPVEEPDERLLGEQDYRGEAFCLTHGEKGYTL